MHPPDCPPWQYEQHPRRSEVLPGRTAEILVALKSGRLNTLEVAVNTRPIHRRLLIELTPPGYGYYAGHYRGEGYRCLRHHQVVVADAHGNPDPNVGYEPASVWLGLREAERLIREGLAILDVNRDIPEAQLPRVQKILQVVVFACRLFDLFLRVHPYVNGNGHIARFLIWSLLGRYGYWPKRFPIEPRPANPPYIHLIERYRTGDFEPLEAFVLRAIT